MQKILTMERKLESVLITRWKRPGTVKVLDCLWRVDAGLIRKRGGRVARRWALMPCAPVSDCMYFTTSLIGKLYFMKAVVASSLHSPSLVALLPCVLIELCCPYKVKTPALPENLRNTCPKTLLISSRLSCETPMITFHRGDTQLPTVLAKCTDTLGPQRARSAFCQHEPSANKIRHNSLALARAISSPAWVKRTERARSPSASAARRPRRAQ